MKILVKTYEHNQAKRTTIMKSKLELILFAFLIYMPFTTSAQDENLFEGELHYRSMENQNESIIKWSCGMAYNGARNTTYLIKGKKVLFRDESTHMCTLLDPDNNKVTLYSDLIGKGMEFDYKKYTSSYLSVFSKEGPNTAFPQLAPSVYRFTVTEEKKQFLNLDVEYVQGRIENKSSSTSFDIYRTNSIKLPHTMNVVQLYGIEIDGLIAKFVYEQEVRGPFGMNLKGYVYSELQEINSRTIDNAELNVPSNIVINYSESPFKIVNLYKENSKYLKKHNIFPTQKNTDVVYKIDDENWDF